jgi:hypothetical protein
VPRREPYVPRHLAEPSVQPRSRRRRALTVGGVAVAATGLAVTSGLAGALPGPDGSATAAAASPQVPTDDATSAPTSVPDVGARGAAALGDRARVLSRSVQRTTVDPTKARVLDQRSGGQVTETEDLTTGDPRDVARAMLAQFGFGADQFSCLDSIYVNESGWNVHADNPSSSAYGIPQALPGSKMASAGADWADNPATQIRWGLGYIKARYGTPCNAWGFKQGHGWY